MSSVLLWWLTVNGPQKAAQASPLARYELAKNKLSDAENPSVSVVHSPMKQFLAMTLLLTDEPLVMTQPSQITPAPINTVLLGSLIRVHSLSLCAPLISVPSVIQQFVISVVFCILTLLSMSERLGMVRMTSSITILLTASFACLLFSIE